MGENLFKSTGEFTPDKLIAGNTMPMIAKGIKIAKGAGTLKRGTLLGTDSIGAYKQTGIDGIGVNCILADDIDATEEEAVASAYLTGEFNTDAVILPEGKEITSYETELRKLGIFLKTVQEY